MIPLWMLLINLSGCSLFKINLTFSQSFSPSRPMLIICVITKLKLCNLIGVTNFIHLTLLFPNLAYLTGWCTHIHTHQQNGIVEHKNHHIVKMGLYFRNLFCSLQILGWRISHNHLFYKSITLPVTYHKSPFDIMFNHPLDYNILCVFNCMCWPHLHPYNILKQQVRSQKYVFLGYSLQHCDFKCPYVASNLVYTTRNIVFDKSQFPLVETPPQPPLSSSTSLHSTITLFSRISPSICTSPFPLVGPSLNPQQSPSLSPTPLITCNLPSLPCSRIVTQAQNNITYPKQLLFGIISYLSSWTLFAYTYSYMLFNCCMVSKMALSHKL